MSSMITIDETLNQPLYVQIGDKLRNNIRSGKLKPGDRLPSERDLAKQLGISTGMVSKAMSILVDEGLIYRRQQRGTIVADIDPSDVTRTRTSTIGLVFANVTGIFMNDIIMGIQNDLYTRNYQTFLCDCNNEIEREVNHIQALVDRGVDGLLVYPVARRRGMPNPFAHYKRLLQSGIPLIFLERYFKNIDTDHVVFDYYTGARHAIKHLVELGHSKIAFIGTPVNITSMTDRLQGYIDGLRKCGIKKDPALVKYVDPPAVTLKTVVDELVEQEVTAILCSSDVFAYRVSMILASRGLGVPDDISLVGFGRRDTELAYPALTTISHSAYEMGQKAAELLFEKLYDGQREIRRISLDTELTLGGSTAEEKKL